MATLPTTHPLVLAIAPTKHGIGFALFEGATEPVDWGVKEARIRKHARGLEHARYLLDLYQPAVLILREAADPADHHSRRIEQLTEAIARLGTERTNVKRYSHTQVQDVFSQFGSITRYGIVKKIHEYLPKLSPFLPPYRKAWMPQDAREGTVDAIALVLTHYYLTD